MDFPTLFRLGFRPHTETDGFRAALSLFRDVARRVPAYKDFLEKNDVNPDLIRTKEDFARLPRTDKPNYISRYSLAEMSWDGTLQNARYVSTSSGSTGVPFFWPRGFAHDVAVGTVFRQIFKDIFKTESESFLFLNSFALGPWLAGFDFYNAVKWAAENGTPALIASTSIVKKEVVSHIQKLLPMYKKIVLAGYPPFIKDIVEECELGGIDFTKTDLRIMVAGEAVSILWKQKILERIGNRGYDAFVNAYGMAEAGVVAHDTPVAQLLREHLDMLPTGTVTTSDGLPVTGLYQYYPEQRYFEAESKQALALTTDAGLPLIRYDTRDTGGILERSIIHQLPEEFRTEAKRLGIDTGSWQLPFVYLNGRKDFSLSLYALMIYVENVKYALEGSSYAPLLSGLFTMSVDHTNNLDQKFIIQVELEGSVIPEGLTETLTKEIIEKLCAVNTEYTKLLASIGDRAKPHVILLPRGQIQTVPGRKHQWLKRT